jgi:hypothetical protein
MNEKVDQMIFQSGTRALYGVVIGFSIWYSISIEVVKQKFHKGRRFRPLDLKRRSPFNNTTT